MATRKEVWKRHPDSDVLWVSSRGRLRRDAYRCRHGKNGTRVVRAGLMPIYVKRGYRRAWVKFRGRERVIHAVVSRLVLQTFVGPAPLGRNQADHVNRRPGDDRLENLRWATPAENKRNSAATRLSVETVRDLRERYNTVAVQFNTFLAELSLVAKQRGLSLVALWGTVRRTDRAWRDAGPVVTIRPLTGNHRQARVAHYE